MNCRTVEEKSIPYQLRGTGSLTRSFKEVCNSFCIEQKSFKKDDPFYCRECLLLDSWRPLVWARSFLFSTHNETIETFCHLENQSLGEHLLFTSENQAINNDACIKPTKGTLVRSSYTFFEIDAADPKLQLAMPYETKATVNYGRSSQFTWSHHGSVLFLSEVFSHYAEALLT